MKKREGFYLTTKYIRHKYNGQVLYKPIIMNIIVRLTILAAGMLIVTEKMKFFLTNYCIIDALL